MSFSSPSTPAIGVGREALGMQMANAKGRRKSSSGQMFNQLHCICCCTAPAPATPRFEDVGGCSCSCFTTYYNKTLMGKPHIFCFPLSLVSIVCSKEIDLFYSWRRRTLHRRRGFSSASDVIVSDFQGSGPYRVASMEDVQQQPCFLGGVEAKSWRGLNSPISQVFS